MTKRKAYTRKASRKPRRKQFKRSATSGGKVTFMKNTLVPDRLILKYSYKDNVSLSGTNPNAFAIKTFRANSIYDPDLDIVNGHQPLGYDQWAVFYNKYRVFKAQITVTIINNNSTGVQCAIVPYNELGTINSVDDSTFEQPHAVTRTVGGNQGMNKVVLKKTIDIPRILGRSHLQYKSSDLVCAQFGANPTEMAYAAIVARTINDSAAPTCQAVVNITYFVELFDRKVQALSYPAGKDSEGDWHQQ